MARPQSNQITVRKRTDGQAGYRAEWRRTASSGERVRESMSFATEAEALAFKAESEARAAAMPPAAPGVALTPSVAPAPAAAVRRRNGLQTFEEFAKGWIADVVRRKSPATQRSYVGILETHVYPTLGSTFVADDHLDAQAVISTITARAEAGVGWGTQKAVIRVISTCLEWARLNGKLRSNPAQRLIKALNDQSGDYVESEPNPLTAAQATAFLTWLQTGLVTTAPVERPVDGPRLRGGQLRSSGYPEWHAYFAVLLATGMRRGEASAIRWSNVYLDAAPYRIRLDRSYSPSLVALARERGERSTGDKALKGRSAIKFRDVEIPDDVAAALRALAQTRRAEALHEKRPLSPYVFLTMRGLRLVSDNQTAVRVFDKGMAALGLAAAGHTIHDCRDTFATVHLEASGGRRLAWVSAQLGHKHISTTLNRYIKWIPDGAAAGYANDLPYVQGMGAKVEEALRARREAEAAKNESTPESAPELTPRLVRRSGNVL